MHAQYFFRYRGHPVIVGFCMPDGTQDYDLSKFVDFSKTDKWYEDADIVPATDLEDLEDNTSQSNAFWDKDRR